MLYRSDDDFKALFTVLLYLNCDEMRDCHNQIKKPPRTKATYIHTQACIQVHFVSSSTVICHLVSLCFMIFVI